MPRKKCSRRKKKKGTKSKKAAMTTKESPVDVWVRIFSFLDIKDLYHCALTCSSMAKVVFDCDDKFDAAWEGAEGGLTKVTRVRSISSAREHCRLFLPTAAFAKACDESGTIPREGELGAGLPVNLMNIRGVTEDSVPTEPIDPEAEEEFFTQMHTTLQQVTTFEEFHRLLYGQDVNPDDFVGQRVPAKEYNHEIFVRVSRQETGELVGQGFVQRGRLTPWFQPIHEQKLVINLQDPGLGLTSTSEFWEFDASAPDLDASSMDPKSVFAYAKAFRFTVVSIHKVDMETRLIRRTTPYNTSNPAPINFETYTYGFPNDGRWKVFTFQWTFGIQDPSFQLGATPLDRYTTLCEMGFVLSYQEVEGRRMSESMWPMLQVSFGKDRRVLRRLIQSLPQFVREQFPEG